MQICREFLHFLEGAGTPLEHIYLWILGQGNGSLEGKLNGNWMGVWASRSARRTKNPLG